MTHMDDDFRARANRIRAQSGPITPVTVETHTAERDSDEHLMAWAILRPQLALILGAVALVLGRSVAMNYFMLDPSTEQLSIAEGGVVMILLVAIGLLFGRSDVISHVALITGAALSFFCEPIYVALAPDLMESVYNPAYVGLVMLNAG